ncbi:MAG: NUDIX hydrolase [Chloroflexi bacterium]|nr:NUDIX hydrolase [Chloroflexota bacterium]MXX84040.1 NUDIX hydrolase [Chloroflexota bacterium]MYA92935.1 NUDIX hydrolase [Chloroflexota bacterium]MYI42134.1 NUDIX hydrolase [Chloroflexota bacterium]
MGKKSKSKRRIRPLALCIFRRGEKILVARGYDKSSGETFCRPIGGKIEFGEPARQTVIREVMEELGAQVTDTRYLGALENIFVYEGKPGHEIMLIFDGRFQDESLNRDDVLLIGKDDGEVLYEASWQHLDDFRTGELPPLYPTGLLELIDSCA